MSFDNNEVFIKSIGGVTNSLATTVQPVVINASAPPMTGYILVATSPTSAEWQTSGFVPALFLLIDGTRPMAGNLSMSGFNINDVNLINGINLQSHADRHLPTGADALVTAAPNTNLSATTTNAQGVALSVSNSAHTHAIDTAAPSTQTPDLVNNIGVASGLARADHIHNIPTAAPITSLSATTTNTQGAATTFANSAHTHAILTGAPSTQTPDQTNTTGVSANLARVDHIHNIPTAAPITNLSSVSINTQGSANTFARSDHSHAIDITGFGLNSLSGLLSVNHGGTGVMTLTSGNFLIGADTNAVITNKTAPAGVVVGTTDIQTLSNKTLSAPTISGNTIVSGGNITGIGLLSSTTFTVSNTYDIKPFYVRLVSNASQVIATGVLTKLTNWTISANNGTIFNAGTNDFTIPVTGVWRIILYGGFAAATSLGSTVSAIMLTDAADVVQYQTRQIRALDLTAQEMDHNLVIEDQFSSGTILRYQVFQNLTGGNVNFGNPASNTTKARVSIYLVTT